MTITFDEDLSPDMQLLDAVTWTGKPSIHEQYPEWLMQLIYDGEFWWDDYQVLMCGDFAITDGDIFALDSLGNIYINYWRLFR